MIVIYKIMEYNKLIMLNININQKYPKRISIVYIRMCILLIKTKFIVKFQGC